MPEVSQHIYHPGIGKAVDGNRLAKAFQRCAGFAIQRGEEESRGDDVNHVLAVDHAVAYALTVIGAHGILPALRVRFPVRPDGFTGPGVYGDHVPAGSRHGIQATVDIAWRGAATLRLKAGTIPGPGHFQLIEVVGGYLIGG